MILRTFILKVAGSVLAGLLLFPEPGRAQAAQSDSAPASRTAPTANPAPPKKKPAKRRRPVRPKKPAPELSLTARAAAVVDDRTGLVLYEKNLTCVRPIASLTKLVTALVFLEADPNLDSVITMEKADRARRGRSSLAVGESFALGDILYACLMASDNRATKALVRSSGLGPDDFIHRMNEVAREVGMDSARFFEVTGLDNRNVATALDCIRLVHAALENPLIARITATERHTFYSANWHRSHTIFTTNRLVRQKWDVVGGKTGFIGQAGYCLVTRVRNSDRQEVTACILGSRSNNRRFADARKLVQWAFKKLAAPEAPAADTP